VALRTILCELLGIDAPIVQAPIGPGARAELAAAVSNAGGFGMLAGTFYQADELRELIRATRALTGKPFGVNFIITEEMHDLVEVSLEESIAAISFFWGNPAPYVGRIHDAGALVMHTVGSAAEARSSVEIGTDVIVTQGWEAGGRVWGTVATFALIPAAVDAVAPTPVVAAGGISDGRGLAAALALGACGAWIGTRFVASEEAWLHPAYKQRIVDATETDTMYSSLFDGGWPDAPHRTLRNSTIARWQEAGSPPSGARPGEGDVIVTISGDRVYRYDANLPRPDSTGDTEPMANYAGQSAALVKRVLPAGEIVAEIIRDAEKTLRGLV
jgi:nitronate monooxygenase